MTAPRRADTEAEQGDQRQVQDGAGRRDHAMMAVLLATGLCISELLNLVPRTRSAPAAR